MERQDQASAALTVAGARSKGETQLRRLAGASVAAVLAVVVLIIGALSAWADAVPYREYDANAWTPAAVTLSGVAYVGNGEYLVVDQNVSDTFPATSGWVLDPATEPGVATAELPGDVAEPTGVDYDELNDRLFIATDEGGDSIIVVITQYLAGGGTQFPIDTAALGSFDGEDPAFDEDANVLYWVDGGGAIHWLEAGLDGVVGEGGDDVHGSAPITLDGGIDDDWEGLAWDPGTGHLFLAHSIAENLHEITVDRVTSTIDPPVETTDISGLSSVFSDVSGMGIGPSSTDPSVNTLWVTSDETGMVVELNIDESELPPPPTSSTTSSTSTSSSSSSSSSTSTTQATTTTTQAPTTTTTQPTTPTTQPPPPPPGGATFDDISGHTHENAIEWLAAEGITQGCNPPDNNLFCPNDNVTRGQMAAFLVRAFDYTDAGSGNYFEDTVGTTFETAIDRLRVAGITQGCNPPDNDEYCPGDLVTRGQMATFLKRGFDGLG